MNVSLKKYQWKIEPVPSVSESPEGVTCELVPVPELPIDLVPETDGPVTCDPVTPETCDLVP